MKVNLESGVLNIMIPAYNAAEFIEPCLDSIFNQVWLSDKKNKINVVVGVDGCEKTKAKLQLISHKYKDLTVLYCKKNKGTYVTLNTILSTLKTGNLIVFGADDMMNPNMLSEVFKTNKVGFIGSHGVLFAPVSLIKGFGGFRSWRCAGDTELLDRIQRSGITLQGYPGLFYRREHSNQITQSKKYGHNSVIRKKYIKIIKSDRPSKTVPKINCYVKLSGKILSFNIATYPAREKTLKLVVKSVIDKVDVVRVCLNNYKKIPNWLTKMGAECIIPKKDLKDKGKFIWSTQLKDEIYFTGDDDLVYTEEYFEKHLQYLAANDAIISSHGRVLKNDAESLTDCTKYAGCLHESEESFQATVAGTGVMVFDLSKIKMDLDKISCVGMVDLGVAIVASKNNIPLIVREHRASELEYLLEADKPTLWSTNLKEMKKQMELIKEIVRADTAEVESPIDNSKYKISGINFYVINMPCELRRYMTFYERVGAFLPNLKHINPVPLTDPKLNEIVDSYGRAPSLEKKKETSIRLSFVKCFKDAIKNGHEHIVIFEDDALPCYNVWQDQIKDTFSLLPEDYGICFLGGYFMRLPGNGFKVKTEKLFELHKDRSYGVIGAHAVLYHKSVFKEMINQLSALERNITETVLCRKIVPNYRAFAARPSIFRQNFIVISDHGTSLHGKLDFRSLEKTSTMNLML